MKVTCCTQNAVKYVESVQERKIFMHLSSDGAAICLALCFPKTYIDLNKVLSTQKKNSKIRTPVGFFFNF